MQIFIETNQKDPKARLSHWSRQRHNFSAAEWLESSVSQRFNAAGPSNTPQRWMLNLQASNCTLKLWPFATLARPAKNIIAYGPWLQVFWTKLCVMCFGVFQVKQQLSVPNLPTNNQRATESTCGHCTFALNFDAKLHLSPEIILNVLQVVLDHRGPR